MRFSGLKILKEGLTGNKGWTNHWRDPEPKQEYDILIIGGCLLYTSPSPRDAHESRMPSSA